MSDRSVVFRRAAEHEFVEACAWYEERRAGLGAEFQDCVEAALDQLALEPLAQSAIYRGVRRVLLRRFPYGVFYLVEAERIVVLAIFHVRRDPRMWRERA